LDRSVIARIGLVCPASRLRFCQQRFSAPQPTFTDEEPRPMPTDILTLPTTLPAEIPGSPTAESLRRGLAVALVVIGVLLTLWILVQLGPVAYGLPAPLFRRSPLGA
jgi:hypothetical protein